MRTDYSEYLGKLAREKYSYFEGVVTAFAIHDSGYVAMLLRPKSEKPNKRDAAEWVQFEDLLFHHETAATTWLADDREN